MVEVSEKFRQLAQDNGRRVWCRIVADGVEFQDDTLIEMSFDDVVHPDWFTIGTTCSMPLLLQSHAGSFLINDPSMAQPSL